MAVKKSAFGDDFAGLRALLAMTDVSVYYPSAFSMTQKWDRPNALKGVFSRN